MLKSDQPTEFMQALMHEIQQPLLVARTTQELIDWKADNPDHKKHLESSEQALGDLTHKLDRIAEAFQWQSGGFDLSMSYLDIKNFLTQVIEDQPVAITIDKSLNEKLFLMSPHYLKEAFTEILKNSFFFNKSKNPEVSIEVSERDDDLIFVIMDNGIGIAEKNWAKIFDLLFVVAESRHATESGLGVGLTKARGIIDKHGGSCTVKTSDPKQGTCIEVVLPLKTLVWG